MFTQLHTHSHYSLLDAIGKPKNLVSKAASYDMQALALTDYSGMYGVIDFYKACKKENIKPLLGIEIALVQDRTQAIGKQQPGTITLLAKNYEGYRALLELASHGNLEGFHEQPSIDRDILKGTTDHLIGFMGGSHSYLGNMILDNESADKIQDTLGVLKSYFNEGDFYLEYIAQDNAVLPKEKKINEYILTLSKNTSTSLFCATNIHYIDPEDKEAYEVAMAIKDGKRVYDEDRRKTKGDRSLQPQEQVEEILQKNNCDKILIASMIETTQEITNKIDIDLPLGTILFPNYASGDEIKVRYEKVKDELIEK